MSTSWLTSKQLNVNFSYCHNKYLAVSRQIFFSFWYFRILEYHCYSEIFRKSFIWLLKAIISNIQVKTWAGSLCQKWYIFMCSWNFRLSICLKTHIIDFRKYYGKCDLYSRFYHCFIFEDLNFSITNFPLTKHDLPLSE